MSNVETDDGHPGDGPTFEEYARTRWAALLRTARLLTGERTAAEDLVQATLVKAYTHWHRVARADSAEAYVRTMLLNEFLGERRRRLRRTGKDHLVAVRDDAVAESDPALRLDLWEAVMSLPPRQRAVLVLRYYEDLTEAEVARTLDVSRGTVKSQASDALRRLRAHYSPDDANTEVSG